MGCLLSQHRGGTSQQCTLCGDKPLVQVLPFLPCPAPLRIACGSHHEAGPYAVIHVHLLCQKERRRCAVVHRKVGQAQVVVLQGGSRARIAFRLILALQYRSRPNALSRMIKSNTFSSSKFQKWGAPMNLWVKAIAGRAQGLTILLTRNRRHICGPSDVV